MLYDYQCTKCDHKHEEFAQMDDKSLKECPKCAKMYSTRVPSSIKLIMGLTTPGRGLNG